MTTFEQNRGEKVALAFVNWLKYGITGSLIVGKSEAIHQIKLNIILPSKQKMT